MTALFSRKQDASRAVIDRAAALTLEKRHILICAGAGMGVDSGLPDFRGKDGFWTAYPMFRAGGFKFRDIAQPKWFRGLPERAWGFYGSRVNTYRATVPHAGFAILADWIATRFESSFVFTSNVDGQFQKAGFDSSRIVECHGSIHHLQCLNGCCKRIWPNGHEFHVDDNLFAAKPLPTCPHCGGMARPNLRMFGDLDFLGKRCANQERLYHDWLASVPVDDLLIIEIGAGTDIPSIRLQSEKIGADLIRINPQDRSEVSLTGCTIALGALDALKRIDDLLSVPQPEISTLN